MLKTISDVADPLFCSAVKDAWLIAPSTEGQTPSPLMAGTEAYAPPWVVGWQNGQPTPHMHDLTCYLLKDAVVSGDGQIWIGQTLVAAPQIMPGYVAGILQVDRGGSDLLRRNREQAPRCIREPCLVATGHGTQVYGHFLIEVLFRLCMAKQALAAGMPRHKVLIEKDAPSWFVDILVSYLEVDPADLEVFEPGRECIVLQNAIVPSRALQEAGFHPAANDMLEALIKRLKGGGEARSPKRVFIIRNGYVNHSAPHRLCTNEADLARIAAKTFGFAPVVIETLAWPDQIALFNNAEVIAGQGGSGLHNALFSPPGSRLGSIGFMNFVQSQIGTLRGQAVGYMAKDFDLAGEFSVDEDLFTEFMHRLCASDGLVS